MGIGYLTGQGGGGSNIKSIQRGLVSMSYDLAAYTYTINSVDINNSIVRLNNNLSQNGSADQNVLKSAFVSATQIKIETLSSGATRPNVSWEVIEFKNVKSIQRITKSIPSSLSSDESTISPINRNKTILFFDYTAGGTNDMSYLQLSTFISSDNTISFYRKSGSSNFSVNIQVVEFK